MLSGSLRYEEYDWVARKGDFFHESPGRTHTLVTDEGMETLFHLGTPIEFLDENDKIIRYTARYRFGQTYDQIST